MCDVGALEIDDVHKGDNGDYQCNVTGLDRHRTSATGKLTIDENEGYLFNYYACICKSIFMKFSL